MRGLETAGWSAGVMGEGMDGWVGIGFGFGFG